MKIYLDDKENVGWIKMPKHSLLDTRFRWLMLGYILGAITIAGMLMYNGAL